MTSHKDTDRTDPLRGPATSRNRARQRAAQLAAVSAVSAAGFAAVALASKRRTVAGVDRAFARKVRISRRTPAGKITAHLSPLGKAYVLGPGAAALAAYVLAAPKRRGPFAAQSRWAAAGAMTFAALLSAFLEPVFDSALPQPPVPVGQSDKRKAVFPSGHAFTSASVGLTCAHVLACEGFIPAGVAYGLGAALPTINGGAKLLLRRHWLSDAVGGVLAGAAVASACCAGYELLRTSE